MKRKIAAILAADIVGYSKLVAEDEEDTLRRLGSYRAVFDDFIKRHEGRIFNTAGDSVLAEFSSAVDAVRCAIDVQESMRTRNLAYPASRQMDFRIGITIGDVVEREGDLLGDGVNIAARLEGLAEAGGICVSRAVHEQVANKLSVPFADIGEQFLKNIPTPVHAFRVAMHAEKPGAAKAAVPPARAEPGSTARGSMPMIIAAGCAAIAAVGVVALWLSQSTPPVAEVKKIAVVEPAPAAPPKTVAVATEQKAPVAAVIPPAPAVPRMPTQLVPESIPFITDKIRIAIRTEYMPAADHKALAISAVGYGLATGRESPEQAAAIALETCNRTRGEFTCEVFAVGSGIVSGRAKPPMPPQPWLKRDAAIEQPFVTKAVPFINASSQPRIDRVYVAGKAPKAFAVSATGFVGYYHGQTSYDEAVRRALEFCGDKGQLACRVIAIDDVFVVPLPSTMTISGFFRVPDNALIAPEARDDVLRRLADNPSGWSGIAVGAAGKTGIATKAASEQAAIDGATADCATRDRSCRVIGLGPFSVVAK